MAELSERPNAFKARLSKEERLAKNASPAGAEGPEDTGEHAMFPRNGIKV